MNGIFWNGTIEENFIGHIMAEVYKDKVYDLFLNNRSNLTIVDVGANIGITSHYFSQFAKQVYSLEPSKEHCNVFEKTMAFNKIENIDLTQKALYIKSGELPLFHNKNKTMFSLHGAVNDGSSEPELVDCTTMEDFFKEKEIDRVDLMKVDIEGSETEVFSHPSFQGVADRISILVTETHAWSGRHPNQVTDALKMAGFTIEAIENDASLIVARR